MAPVHVITGKTNAAGTLVKAASLRSRAYVTFLAGDGEYVKGVVGLAKGLRKAKSAYPLVVAVLPDVPDDHRRILVSQGCIIREIEPVYPPENQTQFAMAYYVINYSKLRIWEFVEYSKMIYLDGDIQVFNNIDHLFDLPDGYFYAVMDCFCEKTWSHSPQYKIGYCQQSPGRVQWPAADPELGPVPPLYFNAAGMLNLANTLVMAMLWRHPENVELREVKVVHYCAAGSKPWRFTGEGENMDREDVKSLVEMWREIYEDETLDFSHDRRSAVDVGDERGALAVAVRESAGTNYLPAPPAA